jgi:hypothetical protein
MYGLVWHRGSCKIEILIKYSVEENFLIFFEKMKKKWVEFFLGIVIFGALLKPSMKLQILVIIKA